MKYLNSSEEYQKLIGNVAERFWRERETIRGFTITWEIFTTEWMMDTLPKRGSLEAEKWKQRRSNLWVTDINQYFLDHGYPCHLFNVPCIGIIFRIDDIAAFEYVKQRVRKQVNQLKKTSEDLDAKQNAAYSPLAKQLMKGHKQSLITHAHMLIGEIETNDLLPDDLKSWVKETIKKCLPAPEYETE